MKPLTYVAGILLAGACLASGQATTNSFVNWETPPVHPVALSPNGDRLAVCNLPDNRLEIFDVTTGMPLPLGNVSVGLDPVTVRFLSTNEVWVANHISDSISIVSLETMNVVATLSTSNEPSDIVFAGLPTRAFVSCAQPNLVQVFDPATRLAITNLVIDGNRPKAMAASPDGAKVYVSVMESGNASTIIGTGVSLGLPSPTPIDFPDSPYGGQNPPPNSGTNFVPAINPTIPEAVAPPRGGLIVKRNASGRWLDDNNGDWTDYISGTNAVFSGRPVGWDMPDRDLAVIGTDTYSITYATGLMNICMDLSVNPASARIAVVGTEAMNQIRFEPALNGTFVRVHLALVDAVSLTNEVRDLNPHLDYSTPSVPEEEREKSIGDPRGIVWSSDGSRAYVTGMGSDSLIILNSDGVRIGLQSTIPLGRGPTGLVLDEARNRLYVLNRFSATLSVVDTVSETVVGTVPLFDPTPQVIQLGRTHLYDTHKTSGAGQVACASCHVDARFDRLAWDLGDPTGALKSLTNGNFGRFPPTLTNDFHPMKGPTTTQTLQDIIGHEPFHWRGDRDGLEQFNITFTNLQGAASGLTDAEMQELKEFLVAVRFPPNPFRQFNNTLPPSLPLPGHTALGRGNLPAGSPLPDGNAVRGLNRFRLSGTTGCIHCHTLPAGLGTDLRWTGSRWLELPTGPLAEHHTAFSAIERSSGLPLQIPHLRNMYDKLGFDFTRTTSRAGFGFSHDGSVDSLVRFIQDGFDFRNDQETADMIAFLLAFTGSDLPAGSMFDADRPPGVPSGDTHAAVGRQITINNPAGDSLINLMISLANPTSTRVELVVKGRQDNLQRGWFYDRATGRFQSDRKSQTHLPSELSQLAAPGSELTYTMVPRDCGRRIGIDRDEDGFFDRDELDFGFDPADSNSHATNQPPAIDLIADHTLYLGQTVTFFVSATDPDIPKQQLTFSLGTNAPAGAVIMPLNGWFTWTPDDTEVPGPHQFTVTVTDNGVPNRSASQPFSITVLELQFASVLVTTNGVTLNWQGVPGQGYLVQFKDDLSNPTWMNLGDAIEATSGLVSVSDLTPGLHRFYRIILEE